MLTLQFNPHLDYQIAAVNSVLNVFEGQPNINHAFSYIVPNNLIISPETILTNLRSVQMENVLPQSTQIEFPLHLTLEMETGTGKTYVYLRTIFELYIKYGFKKFIIVVPTIAIKEGVLKTLDITTQHFKSLYNNIACNYYQYKSTDLIQVKMFAQSLIPQIMVITKDALNKDKNIIHNAYDDLGNKPITIIQQTNPILILDEPQKLEGDATQWGIKELNALFVLRYSATHKNIENLIYKLSPFTAYEKGLVKKIEIATVASDNNPSSKKIIIESVYYAGKKLKARLKVFIKQKSGITFKSITVSNEDKLWEKTNNDYYKGFILSEINMDSKSVIFSNGIKLYEGTSTSKDDEIIRTMIQETIREHLEKRRKFYSLGIKTLSLFFINRVDDYLPKEGWLRKMFEEEFSQLVNTKYPEFASLAPEKIHSGYFSAMKKNSSIENDEKAYELIMKDKERLLSLENPVEFVFSHSALREGWDNPNVMNICTLAYSSSEMKKRQEIGRGMRLVVNQNGERIYERDLNILTVITNETYKEYVAGLQVEFQDEVGETLPPIEEKSKRVSLTLQKNKLGDSHFTKLWALLNQKAKYIVNFDEKKLIEMSIKEIQKIDDSSIHEMKIKITKTGIDTLSLDDIRGRPLREAVLHPKKTNHYPNIITLLQNETKLTKKTILEILNKINNFDLFS